MTRREFQFVEGKSSKFWAVAVEGAAMTIQFGKIGTAGQTADKVFPSPAKAQAEAEKLIAEKTRKGYKEVAAVASTPVDTTKPAPPPQAGIERRLRLSDDDWQRARWRPRPQVVVGPWPEPRPFDFNALKSHLSAEDVWLDRCWAAAAPPDAVTPQEARFWFRVYTEWDSAHVGARRSWNRDLTAADAAHRRALIAGLTAEAFDRPIPFEELQGGFARFEYDALPHWLLLRLLARDLHPVGWLRLVCSNPSVSLTRRHREEAADWFEREMLPRLTEEERGAVRDFLRGQVEELIAAPALGYAGDIDAYRTAARRATAAMIAVPLALDESRRFIEALSPDSPMTEDGTVQALMLALPDPAVVDREVRRLGLPFHCDSAFNPFDARAWLAHTEHAGLDYLAATFPASLPSDQLTQALEVLMLAESPEAARALLTVKVGLKSAPLVARVAKWLDEHPEHTVAGLTPLAGEKTGVGQAAARWLDAHRRRSQPAGTEPAPGKAAPEVLAILAAAKRPKKALPSFADPVVLPPLPGLTAADVTLVLDGLRGGSPVVEALRRHGDRPALAEFTWALFEGWLTAGAPPKENWALLALGHFGDDSTVWRLTPLLRAWPGEGQHKRAVAGLEVLRTIGTDAALTALNGVALKVKFKGLQDRARELMDLIAADRGLTRDQLEDRVVPDLGLDADGSRTFDFGPRQFRLTLTDELTAELTDEAGKALKDLPKPGAKDDAQKAAAAAAGWKEFKAQLRQAAPIQVARLEEAMVTGRAWTADEFRTLLVCHPLMSRLVRRLVWEGPAPFRVTEDGSAVTHAEAPVSLDGATIRVAHRLRLTPGQVGSWRIALDALDIEPPFPQLERPVFAPQPEETAATEFARPTGPLPSAKVRGTLEGRQWRRHMHDHGGIIGFSKAYVAAGVTAVVGITPGIPIGFYEDSDQRVEAVFFVAGTDHGSRYDDVFYRVARLRLGGVDAVAFSETVRDLTSMAPGK